MDFRVCVDGSDPTRVALFGDLDLATAPEVSACLEGLAGDIEVDCSGLSFIDASGLGLFFKAHMRCEDEGAKLTLIDPSALAMRVLEITDLDSRLNIRFENAATR